MATAGRRWYPPLVDDRSPPEKAATLLESVLELRAPGQAAPVCLGAMNFGRRTDEGESKRILARALELGVRFRQR